MTAPVAKFQSGTISVTEWENQGQYGTIRSFSIQKRYMDKQDNQWKDSSSFTAADLGILAALCNAAISSNCKVSTPAPQQQPAPQYGYAQAGAAAYPPSSAPAPNVPPPPPNDRDAPF